MIAYTMFQVAWWFFVVLAIAYFFTEWFDD